MTRLAVVLALACGGLGALAAVVSLPEGSAAPALRPAPGVIFSDDFERGLSTSRNGPGWEAGEAPNVEVSTDLAHGGKHSLRFRYRGKPDCQDASAELRFSLGRPLREVWLEYYIYYPAGGEGGSARYYHRWEGRACPPVNSPDNNKFLAMFGPKYQAEPTALIQTWTTTLATSVPPTRPGDSRIATAYTKAGLKGATPNSANYMNFITNADRGRWLRIRVHMRVADWAQNDGVIQLWKDGALILDDRSLPWYDTSRQANYLTQGYLMGWSNSGFSETTYIYVDDFSIMDSNPGW